MKSSDADTSRGRKTDVNMESMPPPKRTKTENETERGAEIKAETGGVKEVFLKITWVTTLVVVYEHFSSKNSKHLLVIDSQVGRSAGLF